jgi:chemotaxis protein MotA
MDLALILGLLGVIGAVTYGAPGDLLDVLSLSTLVLVLGGGLAVLLISHPLGGVIALPRVLLRALRPKQTTIVDLLERIVGFAETARREGILALEQAVEPYDEPSLAQGVRLAVDGTEPDLIMDILENEMEYVERRHRAQQRLLHDWGHSCLGVAALGALLAAATAPSAWVAGAAVPLLYGGVCSWVLGQPLARKLQVAHEQEILCKRMVIEGVMAVQCGDNPRIVEIKLLTFLPRSLHPVDERRPVAAADDGDWEEEEDDIVVEQTS